MGDANCPYCHGSGEVSGVVDDIEFRSICCCSGGIEEWVLWLLYEDVPAGQEYTI
jgi:hypothetical protein